MNNIIFQPLNYFIQLPIKQIIFSENNFECQIYIYIYTRMYIGIKTHTSNINVYMNI